ncbi:MAG: glycosyltransferase [Verrucomicrobia bacterium]|jgi:glycosyltransferase involved in cell wall biosynthesis|nr:glycosyltransferase [Verrucomicrobiota bacterium]
MFSVLINNYNYQHFVGEAIASAIAQGPVAKEIIVVDDGSTDQSLNVCRHWASRDSRVKIVEKSNAGQLSAFNAAFRQSTGEFISFLDADDVYLDGYLNRLAALYREKVHVGFVACRCRLQGVENVAVPWPTHVHDHDYGITFFRTLIGNDWIGAPTSGLSMRREIADEVLPCPLESAWRTRADDVLVYGASIAGARKYYLAEEGFIYRVHGGNHWFNCPESPLQSSQHERKLQRLYGHFLGPISAGLSFRIASQGLPRLIAREFRTIPVPLLEERRKYIWMIRAQSGPRWLLSQWKVVRHYWKFGRLRERPT